MAADFLGLLRVQPVDEVMELGVVVVGDAHGLTILPSGLGPGPVQAVRARWVRAAGWVAVPVAAWASS
nr:hypothetical protein KPHV_24290 [Kitasatospora purpeofusca]